MFDRGIPKPLAATHADLEKVMRLGQNPDQSEESLLMLLNLDGNERDGLSLAARLLRSNNLLDKALPPTKSQLRVLSETVVFTEQLLDVLANHSETPDQLLVASNMIAVAERQIVREGGACPLATSLYEKVALTRPELIDKEVYEQMGGIGAILGLLHELMNGMGNVGNDGNVYIEIVDLRDRDSN